VDRRRFLRPAALVVAAAVVVLVFVRAGSAPPEHDGGGAATDASGSATSSSDRTDPTDPVGASGADAFPRSPDGAVAAATAYGLALDGPDVFDAEHRGQVLDAVASAGARADLKATFAEGLELISSQLGLDASAREDPGFVWRVVPGGWQLREFDRDGATVAIWAAVVVMADDVLLVEPAWRTTEVTLVWEGGGWRLVGFQTESGPNPAFATGAAGGEPVGRQINAFAPYRHWPHHVGPEADR
jgi:hypothetical protein